MSGVQTVSGFSLNSFQCYLYIFVLTVELKWCNQSHFCWLYIGCITCCNSLTFDNWQIHKTCLIFWLFGISKWSVFFSRLLIQIKTKLTTSFHKVKRRKKRIFLLLPVLPSSFFFFLFHRFEHSQVFILLKALMLFSASEDEFSATRRNLTGVSSPVN